MPKEWDEVFKDYVILQDMSHALPHIRVIDRETNKTHYLNFEEPLYVAYVDENLEYDTDILRYGFESLKTPESVVDYNLKTRTR
jgi:oligopeptidase B